MMTLEKIKCRAVKYAGAFAAALMCFYMAAFPASAAESGIAAVTDDGRSVYCYMKGVSGVKDTTAQIGNVICDDIEVSALSGREPPLRTVILLDNSVSIKRSKRADIKKLMDGLIEGRMEGESFRVGTFGDSITWLCDYSVDYEAVQESIDSIAYKNQTTHFGDCLYQVLAQISEAGFQEYTRVIMISDGADNQKLGYTNLEVSTCVKESGIPVYTIGMPGDNEALETMFAFSRVSNAGWYLLDGSKDIAEILEELEADHDMVCVKLTPDESLLDGSQKQIRLVLQTAESETAVTASVTMPLGEGRQLKEEQLTESITASKEQPTEEAAAASSKALPTISPTGSTKEASGSDSEGISMKDIIGVAIVLAVAVLAAFLLFLLFRLIDRRSAAKKEKANRENAGNTQREAQADRANARMGGAGASDHTWRVQDEMNRSNAGGPSNAFASSDAAYAHSGETVVLFGQSHGDFGIQTYLILKDVERPASMFKVVINQVIRIGRKEADIVIDYDKYISSRQCEIIKRGELLYIRDIGSTNGTYYDGMRVYDQEVPIVSGGTVQMGRSRFVITIVRE